MNNLVVRRAMGALVFMVSLTVAAGIASAQDKEVKDAGREAREAANVLSEMMKKPDDFIPRELLQKAQGIGIFPGVVKGAFGIGGRFGDGVVSRRTSAGWSVPVFYDLGGASFGLQIGVKKTDYIMLFMNEDSMRDVLDGNFEFGGAVSFAAGPVGRTAGAGTNPTLDAGVLTWSRSKGAFIGASLKGAVLTADNSTNQEVYGMNGKEILENPQSVKTAGLPSNITSFNDIIARYAGKP